MTVYLDVLLGRRVVAPDGQVAGRIEEIRVDDASATVTAYVLGAAGLLERLNVGTRRLLGRRTSGHVARWDQMDVGDPRRPRLRCAVDELGDL
jgi:sporulation protein YlmC with PRC-barrel domain